MHPVPIPDRGSRWQRPPALISTTDPFGPGRADVQPQRSPAVDALLAWERHSRNMRRMLARAASDHLFQAASLLRQVPSTDAVVLSAAGTAEALYALDEAARMLGGALPTAFTALADQLPAWASALKQQHRAAAASAEHDRHSLVRMPRWRRW